MAEKLIRCSFCGKTQAQVKRIMSGPNAYICNECVELCSTILHEEMYETGSSELAVPDHLPTPKEIKEYMDGYIIGQDEAKIALSVAEHHSNLVPWQRVARATGASLVYLYPGPDGRLTRREIQEKITARTRLAAVAQVSNVLGLEAPVEDITARAHSVGAVVVLDCAQSVPHMPVDVKALDVDFAAFSGHKL